MDTFEEMKLHLEQAEDAQNHRAKLEHLVTARGLLQELVDDAEHDIADKSKNLYGLYLQRCLNQFTQTAPVTFEIYRGLLRLVNPGSDSTRYIFGHDIGVVSAFNEFNKRHSWIPNFEFKV
ncbi:glypican family protein [Lysobacter soyae]|uniref:Glypican family protein n=1 Tax=Lysobacter soyae TaxID=2764185 RepID=A0ABX8WRU0_9GAMM|nr:glypican family protein [Lysobacter sp. CJ11]QYR53553.1 glypican family protein [Lysobacter sp. CJ11]